MKPFLCIFLPALLATALLSSCNTWSALDRRIDRNPSLFLDLKDSERELVMNGEIKEGMSRDAVYLAWGRPDAVRRGSENGKGHESWAYFDAVAIQRNTVSYGYGGGHSPFYSHFGVHPRYGYCSGPGWSFGTEIDYVNQLSRSVKFSNKRVIAWESNR